MVYRRHTDSGLSVRTGGGGFLSAIRVWCAGYEDRMKADIKSSLPEVKASKSVKRFLDTSPGGLCPLDRHKMSNLYIVMAHGHSSMNPSTCNVYGR